MLSPCIRQVIHALLTRPPLIHTSLGFNMDPFDLHVLGTPPAFILSQDQTLIISFSRLAHAWLLLFLGRILPECFVLEFFSAFSGRYSLESFKVIPLFSYQGSLSLFPRQLLYFITAIRFCQALFLSFLFPKCNAQQRMLYYHVYFPLSTSFYKFFQLFYFQEMRISDKA